MMTSSISRRRRRHEEAGSAERETIRMHGAAKPRRRAGRWLLSNGSFSLVVAGILGGMVREVKAQEFTNGGTVSMTCESDCSCSGTSDDGTIKVLPNPSSEELIALAGGEYSEILETTCGMSVIAVGSTLYELAGVDLGDREFGVASLSTATCTLDDAWDSTAVCYGGEVSGLSLANGANLELIFHYGSWMDDKTYYKSRVNALVGSLAVDTDVDTVVGKICLEFDFVSQIFSVIVGEETFPYNYEFEIPGQTTSADLSVAAGPSSSAGAFMCGVAAPTPSPVKPPDTPLPTPAPAPVEPEPTTRPVSVDPTSEPTAETASTLPPLPIPTPQPAAVSDAPVTLAPMPLGGDTAAPVGEDTPGPVPAGSVAPAAASTSVPVGANSTEQPLPLKTQSPTAVETLAPVNRADQEEYACVLPDPGPCTTSIPSVADKNVGFGAYYDLDCNTTLAADGKVPGCVPDTESCRLCFFNTRLYGESRPDTDLPEYPDCPCCVLAIYEKDVAENEAGLRCESVSPAPVASPSSAAPSISPQTETFIFDDKGRGGSADRGGGLALAALGLFTVLTFFPSCST